MSRSDSYSLRDTGDLLDMLGSEGDISSLVEGWDADEAEGASS